MTKSRIFGFYSALNPNIRGTGMTSVSFPLSYPSRIKFVYLTGSPCLGQLPGSIIWTILDLRRDWLLVCKILVSRLGLGGIIEPQLCLLLHQILKAKEGFSSGTPPLSRGTGGCAGGECAPTRIPRGAAPPCCERCSRGGTWSYDRPSSM